MSFRTPEASRTTQEPGEGGGHGPQPLAACEHLTSQGVADRSESPGEDLRERRAAAAGAWVQSPAPPLRGCVTSGSPPNHAEPSLSPPWAGRNGSAQIQCGTAETGPGTRQLRASVAFGILISIIIPIVAARFIPRDCHTLESITSGLKGLRSPVRPHPRRPHKILPRHEDV